MSFFVSQIDKPSLKLYNKYDIQKGCNNMKKLLTGLLAVCLLFTFLSCADKTEKEDGNLKNNDFASENEKDTENVSKQKQEVKGNPLGFENEKLFSAVCRALGKESENITKEDILNIKYISIDREDNGEYSLYIGLHDYIDVYFKLAKNNGDIELSKKLISLAKKATFKCNKDEEVFSDIAKFTKVNVFEYYDIPVNDVSFLKDLDELYFGFFDNNGITDVSALSDYNPKYLKELDFTGNDIKNWSALEHIKEKVIVHFKMQEYDNGKGEKIQMPFVLTLEDKIKQDKEREEKQNNQNGQDEQKKTPTFVDKDGNPVDFGSLFE